MNIYEKLKELPLFTIQDVNVYYRNTGSARSAVKRLMARDQIRKIRSNLYTCYGEEWDGPAADKFQIASAITETACVSHLSAMEYHGFTDQFFEDVYVSSDARFTDFSFDENRFHYLRTRMKESVEEPRFRGGVRVTGPERTLVDCLKDLDKISRLSGINGPETILEIVAEMGSLDEAGLLRCLALYDNQFLYQKAGFLLQKQQRKSGLSKEFFAICRSRIGKSKRYLSAPGSGSSDYSDASNDITARSGSRRGGNSDTSDDITARSGSRRGGYSDTSNDTTARSGSRRGGNSDASDDTTARSGSRRGGYSDTSNYTSGKTGRKIKNAARITDSVYNSEWKLVVPASLA